MTTLAEASHSEKRNRTFAGKPRKISSGVPLTRVQRVAHRSDILLDDQISLVKDTQDALEKAMLMMSSSRDPREQVGWQAEVDRLKLQCDEMLLILKVVRKLSVELLYAKSEVENASQNQGNVGAARKRVVWLEDRMEHLLSRYRNEFRMNSPLPIQPRFVTEKRARPGAGRIGTQQTKRSMDSSRPKSILKVPSKNLDGDGGDGEYSAGRPNASRERGGGGSGGRHLVVQRNDLRGLETDETQSTGDEGSRGAEFEARQRLALRSRGRPGGAGERGRRGRGQAETEGDGGDGGKMPDISRHPVATDTEDETDADDAGHPIRRRPRPGGAGDRRSRESVTRHPEGLDEPDQNVNDNKVLQHRQRLAPGRAGRTRGKVTDTEDEEGELSARSDLDDAEIADGVFMTQESAQSADESTRADSTESPVSKGDGAQADDEEDEEEDGKEEGDVDEGAAYWESPHHKFEYSEHREAISRENPMSYHNLGLAVCSTFIEPAPEMAPNLPWRPIKKGEQISDVHKVALDKIAERIHDIWGKMEDAAVRSTDIVTPFKSPDKEGAFLSQIDGSIGSPRSSPLPLESRRPSPMKGDKSRPQTKMSLVRARSVAKSVTEFEEPLPMPFASPPRTAISSVAPNLLYHPKPIPPPAVLPLTRTNQEKFYPRISSEWNADDPEETGRAVRIVNQMNVAKETNLLVYRSKESKRKKSSKSALKIQPVHGGVAMKRWRNVAVANAMATAQISAFMGSKHTGQGKNLDKEEPRWKRVDHVLQMLTSDRVIERRDATRHLGELDVIEPEVVEALADRLDNDDDARVCYEAAKSLMSIGEWTEPVVRLIVHYLEEGTYQAKRDLVESMIKARGNAYINKTKPEIRALVHVLKRTCAAENTGDLGFDCAVCLGCMCVPDRLAKLKLMGSLSSNDVNVTARSLEILVRQMHASEPAVVKMVLHQLQFSTAWKYRAAAAKLLVHIGPKCLSSEEDAKMIFDIADKRLYDDPSREVRSEIAVMMASLGMREMLVELVEKRLYEEEDDDRAHGVLAVGVLGMKSERMQRTLLEMLELDSCEYVRIQVIRTLAELGLTSVKVMRALRNLERSEGSLSRESTKALAILTAIKQRQSARSPRRTPTRSPSLLASPGTGANRKGPTTPVMRKVVRQTAGM